MEEYAVMRMEPDGSETLVGFAKNPTEMAILVDDDRKKVDYDIGYHWNPGKERRHETKADCSA